MTEHDETPETPPAPDSAAAPAPDPDALREENARLSDRLLRLQAEFDNFRKRSAKERTEWTDRAVEGLVLDLLPALDAFDRAIESAGQGADAATLAEGIRLIRRLLDAPLVARGLAAVEAVGKPFDANLHEASASQPATAENPAGTVVTEILKGYRLGERTIRPSRTVVAVESPAASSPGLVAEEE